MVLVPPGQPRTPPAALHALVKALWCAVGAIVQPDPGVPVLPQGFMHDFDAPHQLDGGLPGDGYHSYLAPFPVAAFPPVL